MFIPFFVILTKAAKFIDSKKEKYKSNHHYYFIKLPSKEKFVSKNGITT